MNNVTFSNNGHHKKSVFIGNKADKVGVINFQDKIPEGEEEEIAETLTEKLTGKKQKIELGKCFIRR